VSDQADAKGERENRGRKKREREREREAVDQAATGGSSYTHVCVE
jgi:hypothetical protein